MNELYLLIPLAIGVASYLYAVFSPEARAERVPVRRESSHD